MPDSTEYIARGKIIAMKDGLVVFRPIATSYELLLKDESKSGDKLIGTLLDARLHGQARKLLTVPSGGNFIAPIFGPPRIVQGRVLHVGGRTLVVHAGAPFVIHLPVSDSAVDLYHGGIETGALINVNLLAGASFELVAGVNKQAQVVC